MKKLLLLAIVVLGISAVSFGQISTSESVETSATIITPLSISKTAGTSDLLFGSIIADADGGTVVVAPGATSATYNNGLKAPVGLAGTVHAATFTVSGLPGATFSIVLPEDFAISGPDGSTPMDVTNINSNPAEGNSVLDGTGHKTISVGATLTLGNNQMAGLYSNEDALEVTVAYE